MSGRTQGVGAAGAAILVTVGLSACATLGLGATPSHSIQASAPESATSVPVTPSASSASATPTPSAKPVSATGRMNLYNNLVSKAFVGTCAKVDDQPTLALSDKRNDFFETVEVSVVLDADAGAVASIDAAFGEDAEGITRQLAYSSDPKLKGTSAALVENGGTDYSITGKAMIYEDKATKGELIPFSIQVKCASADW